MKSHQATILTLAVSIVVAAAQNFSTNSSNFELKAALLRGADGDRYVPAAEWKGVYEKSFWSSGGSFDAFYQAKSEGALATDARANSKNLFGQIELGLNYLWEQPGEVDSFAAAQARRRNGNQTNVGQFVQSGRVHYGDFKLGATARFETDQPFENYNFVTGPSLGYVHLKGDSWSDAWWSLIPKIQVGYHRVEVLQSRDFARLGAAEDSYWRFTGEADWTLKIGQWYDPGYQTGWGGIGLHGGLKYYKGYEMPAAAVAAAFDESAYYSGGINYRFKTDSRIGKWISFMYLTVGHGRIPPQRNNETQAFLGIAVNFD